MTDNSVHFLWQDVDAARGHRTGVCLHGHTLHSKECLSFLPRYLRAIPGAAPLVRRQERRVDFSRAYWTPPLTPAAALRLERRQIADMGLVPIVSLTDHDDVEAGLSLGIAFRRAETPVSVEWTVAYRRSIFHIGIHNLPAGSEREWMAVLAQYTAAPVEAMLPDIMETLDAIPGVLIVLNHPFWLEEGVAEEDHEPALHELLRRCGAWVHGFELNGTRPWRENRDTIRLAGRYQRPVISGGDRHGCEPSACVNLTSASTFEEFADEVREGRSTVAFLPHYRVPMPERLVEAVWDILRPYPEFPDRRLWTDRVFYQCGDGVDRPVSELWKGRTPLSLRMLAGFVGLCATTHVRSALRVLLADRAEMAF